MCVKLMNGRNMDSEIIAESQISNLPLTQDTVKKKSQNQYAWVIVFHFDIHTIKPFSIVRLRDFATQNSNFPWHGIKGEMTREFRITLHEFSTSPGKQFFVFAKIQYGKYLIFYCLSFCPFYSPLYNFYCPHIIS